MPKKSFTLGPEFRDRLYRLRDEAGLTIAELADKAQLSRRCVRDIASGKRTHALEKTLRQLADALGCSFRYLVEGVDEEPGAAPPAPVRTRRATMVVIVAVAAVAAFLAFSRGWHLPAGWRDARPVERAPELVVTLTPDRYGISVTDKRSGRALWNTAHGAKVEVMTRAPWPGEPIVYGLGGSELGCGKLFVRDARTGKELWSDHPDWDEIIAAYGNDLANSGGFNVISPRGTAGLQFGDLDGDGERELIAYCQHMKWFPCYVRAYRPNGEVLGTYYMSGFVRDIHVGDLDGDGKDEVVIAGTNNAYDSGMVTLLDESHFAGASADSVALTACALPDSARCRLVFAGLDAELCRYLGVRRLEAANIQSYIAPDGTAHMNVDVGTEELGMLVVSLDGCLRPLSVAPSDGLLMTASSWPEDVRERFLSGLDDWRERAVHFSARPVATAFAYE